MFPYLGVLWACHLCNLWPPPGFALPRPAHLDIFILFFFKYSCSKHELKLGIDLNRASEERSEPQKWHTYHFTKESTPEGRNCGRSLVSFTQMWTSPDGGILRPAMMYHEHGKWINNARTSINLRILENGWLNLAHFPPNLHPSRFCRHFNRSNFQSIWPLFGYNGPPYVFYNTETSGSVCSSYLFSDRIRKLPIWILLALASPCESIKACCGHSPNVTATEWGA